MESNLIPVGIPFYYSLTLLQGGPPPAHQYPHEAARAQEKSLGAAHEEEAGGGGENSISDISVEMLVLEPRLHGLLGDGEEGGFDDFSGYYGRHFLGRHRHVSKEDSAAVDVHLAHRRRPHIASWP